ncbi:MAG: putative toxin-antitoxin system toxin component, PIN family [Ginsengibacter sp.]
MKVVIDTNVFLVIIPSLSRYHIAYEALKENRYNLAVSNEILMEYEEQLSFRYAIADASEILENLLENQNIKLCNPEYKWNLITKDPDDNKFVDCAIASNADWIVTNDKHFHLLRDIDFPKVNVISIEEFIDLLSSQD